MKYNPHRYRDPIVTRFLDMCSMTTPHGTESYCWRNIPGRMYVDKFNNVHVMVGSSTTMFCSHLDTACSTSERVWFKFDGDIVGTDGRTVLGADDKAGATIMCYMIEQRVPGWYVFFSGEERGCIGSSALAAALAKNAPIGVDIPDISTIKRCISFDRRGYDSVVTHQMGSRCCSDAFAQELADSIGLGMEPDPSGVYTDSAQFTDLIPECTNISVGYFDQHTTKETQDLHFLKVLAKRCVNVDWDDLTTERDPHEIDPDDYGYFRYSSIYTGRSIWDNDATDDSVDYQAWLSKVILDECHIDGCTIAESYEVLTYEGLDADEIDSVMTQQYGKDWRAIHEAQQNES
jgi:hypothetical protein